jgi:hypothetical protein
VGRLHQWQAVLPQTVYLEPRMLVITRAKIVDPQRKAAPKSSFEGLVHAEPIEIPLRGIYTACTISSVFTSSALVDSEHRNTRARSKGLADDSSKGQSPKETVYLTTELINTSGEQITLQAGHHRN